jgi:16S rRNA (guanine527-N7)-methyltransferase
MTLSKMDFCAWSRFSACWKTTDCGEELSEAMNAIKLLGGKVLSPYDYSIPHTDITHRVVLLEKVSPTPKGYPRRWAKIQKAPL